METVDRFELNRFLVFAMPEKGPKILEPIIRNLLGQDNNDGHFTSFRS